MCDEQRGFHNHRSCEFSCINTVHDFVSCLNNGGQCDVLFFLDFKKAFDKVLHSLLFYMLHHYGIRGLLLLWIKGFLTNRLQQVTRKATLPMSYLAFYNAPPWHLYCFYYISLTVFVTSYMLTISYCIQTSIVHFVTDCAHLQEDLNLLYQWSVIWLILLSVNSYKSQIKRILLTTTIICDLPRKNQPSSHIQICSYSGS